VDVSPDVESSAPRGRGRLGPALAVLAAVLGLLALVAVASGGDTPTGTDGTRRPSHLLIDTLVSLYIVLMAFGAVLFVYLMFLRKDSAYERARLRRESRFRSVVVFVLFLGALALALRLAEERGQDGRLRPPVTATNPTPPSDTGPRKGYEPEFAVLPVAIVLGVGGLAVVALVLAARARRKALGPLRDPRLLEALEDVLAESLDDLRAERDPRRAVVAAYARLERTLAAYGVPRAAAEAPAEYLARILTELEVSHDSAGRLTALFERAKFSQHEVDASMKEEAIDALETARRELAEARERELAARDAALAEARARAAGT
jgi:uncharacterized membrane protein YidH (DUF202 family)